MRSPGCCALFIVCSALAGSVAGAASSTPWPEIPSPPDAKVEWVADSMRVNGVPMRVMRFTSTEARSAVVDYYRSYWSGGYPTRPSVRVAGNQTVVGQAHGPYYMTVAVKDAPQGTSQGLISVSQVAGSKIERSPGELPLMPGAKVLQVVESNDPGRRSREVFVRNPQAPASVMSYYQAALADGGWQAVQYTDVPRNGASAGGSFAVFRRERSELQLSVAPAPGGRGSLLLADLITKDTGPQRF
ncbi:MAG TPA: hypothetical protein VEH00_05820 [Steroidobacteraceae bacterium]|nr:hypothetical protein [Steroidobacteraceae bacterium]